MVMLDSVGIPSGVHVKKPPMIFIGGSPPPEREQKGSWALSVNGLLSPPPPPQRKPKNTDFRPWITSRAGERERKWPSHADPCPRHPLQEESYVFPHSTEKEELSLVLRTL